MRFKYWATSLAVLLLCGCAGNWSHADTVVVYVSEDRVFAEPTLKNFERITGIAVEAVFDPKEPKNGGVMSRLIAERNHPRADVYWATEPVSAELLKQDGISASYRSPNAAGIPSEFKDPDGHWTGFAARARVMMSRRAMKDRPEGLAAYTDPRNRGRAVIANPLFSTTGVHIAALFTVWGDQRATAFLDAMKQNQVRVSAYNGQSADLVMAGTVDFALVDSDVAVSRLRRNKELDMIYPDQLQDQDGVFIVPSAVVLIRGARHLQNARRLIDYLLSKETERRLAFDDCVRIPLHNGIETPLEIRRIEAMHTMKVDFAAVARKMLEIQPVLKAWSGR
jgi:iron(III) transport system substrate-binding protein